MFLFISPFKTCLFAWMQLKLKLAPCGIGPERRNEARLRFTKFEVNEIFIFFLKRLFNLSASVSGQLIASSTVLRLNCLLGPFILTIVKFQKRPTITKSASYRKGSCPLALVIAFPCKHNCTLFR